jgi:hypothetical protein
LAIPSLVLAFFVRSASPLWAQAFFFLVEIQGVFPPTNGPFYRWNEKYWTKLARWLLMRSVPEYGANNTNQKPLVANHDKK